jgi:hypothetical protein
MNVLVQIANKMEFHKECSKALGHESKDAPSGILLLIWLIPSTLHWHVLAVIGTEANNSI